MSGGVDRRQLILHEAAGLFATRGVAKTTVRDIADAVGILSGSLYHHFPSKDALLTRIITSYLDDLLTRYADVCSGSDDPLTRLHGLVTASLETMEQHPHAAEIYQNESAYIRRLPEYGELRVAARKVQRNWIMTVNEGVAAGQLRDDIAPDVFYRLIRDAVWLSVRWYKPTPSYPITQLAQDCTAIFLDGFKAGPRRRRR